MSDQESRTALESLVSNKCTIENECKSDKKEEESESASAIAVQNMEPSGCPFLSGALSSVPPNKSRTKSSNKMFMEWQTSISIASEPIVYHDYLGLDKILNAQFPISKKYGNMVHDEHLFIVIHQSNPSPPQTLILNY